MSVCVCVCVYVRALARSHVRKQVMEFSRVCSGFKEQPSVHITSYSEEQEG